MWYTNISLYLYIHNIFIKISFVSFVLFTWSSVLNTNAECMLSLTPEPRIFVLFKYLSHSTVPKEPWPFFLQGRKWWMNADEPWQALACCMEIANASRAPDYTKYISYFPVHQVQTQCVFNKCCSVCASELWSFWALLECWKDGLLANKMNLQLPDGTKFYSNFNMLLIVFKG